MIQSLKQRRRRWLVVCLIASFGLLLLAYRYWSTPRHLSDAVSVENPRWSPDGAALVMDCAFQTDWEGYPKYEVCLTKSDLSGLVRLAPEATTSWSLYSVWSPSGRELVFEHPTGGLVIAELPSLTTRSLINTECNEPAWSPNGQQIVCIYGAGIIKVIEVATGQVTEFTTSGSAFSPM